MTIEFALAYIPRRMEELGFGNRYYMKPRHLVLQSGEKREIEGYNQYFLLVDTVSEVSINSEFGCYDLMMMETNEQQYEHRGLITINNHSQEIKHLRFIQVIPKHD